MTHTDKQPQTVFCICKDEDAQAFLYYTPDYKPGSMFKRLAIPVKEHESVYIHTPEELQALKAEWQREQWISVKDRLPEYMDCAIIYTKNGIVTESQHCGDGSFFSEPYTFNDVTHWMPLPQPPKP